MRGDSPLALPLEFACSLFDVDGEDAARGGRAELVGGGRAVVAREQPPQPLPLAVRLGGRVRAAAVRDA